MYHVTIKNLGGTENVLYYPGDDKCCIYDSKLKLKVGECGEFEFIVPNVNLYYSELKEWSIITVYRDDEEYWRGFISDLSIDWLGNASVYCIEDLAWLNYDVYAIKAGKATRKALLDSIVATYNSNSGISGTDKEFSVGAIYFGGTDEIEYSFNYDETMLSCLRQICGDDLFVRVRRANGKRYIDLLRLEDFATENDQDIQFGYNLLDYTKEMDTGNMLNVIHPYGAELESEVFEGQAERLKGSTLQNGTSIGKYGRIAKNVIFDSVTDLTTLNQEAQKYLNLNSQPRVTMQLTALDLSELSVSTNKLDIGEKIRVVAEPYDIDQWIHITEMEINLQDLSKNQYTMSDSVRKNTTLTAQTISAAQQAEALPTESEILKAAKKNAVALLSGGDGGYLSFIFDKNGQMNGFQITDTKDVSQATKKWVWNENGLGFMYKDAKGIWQTNNAMTKDGSIVADRITTGTMNCDRLNGGTIKGQYIHGGTIEGALVKGGIFETINSDGSDTKVHIENGEAKFYCDGEHYATFYGPYEADHTRNNTMGQRQLFTIGPNKIGHYWWNRNLPVHQWSYEDIEITYLFEVLNYWKKTGEWVKK